MSVLAEPVTLGPRTVRNRIVFPAHLTNAAVAGLPSPQQAAYYAARAAGGAGLVIVEEQSADPADRPYEKALRGTDPRVVAGYRAITEAVHAHGALVLAQVGHNGGQSSSLYSRAPVEAPSPLPDPMFREVPVALDATGIDRIVAGFATVARHAVEGGFDGVELQGSQASLIRQFLSPLTNHRTDRFADGVVFLRAVLAAVRAELGPDRVLGVRLQGDEGLAGGLSAEDAARVAVAVADQVDVINTAVGVATATLPLIEPPMGVPAGYASAVPTAVRVAVAGRVPVIGVGRYTTPEQAEHAVAAGACDLVGAVRAQIADPEFARVALTGRRPRRCIGCNQECIAAVGLNRRLGCVVNPDAGREAAPVPAAGRPRRVLVVGGGPAGLAAAAEAAERGHAVHLVERTEHLGGQVRLAATAPERGELAHLVEDLVRRCRDAGVRITLGADGAHHADAHGADAVVVATGSSPALPAWAAGVPGVVDVADVLAGADVPAASRGPVLVVDEVGGHPAPSVAELLARRGATVTLMTAGMVAAEALGPTLERERWRRRAAGLGIVTTTDRVVLAAAPGPVLQVLHHPTGELTTVTPDLVVCAAPRVPTVPDLIGTPVGDALAPRGLAAAVREGTDAARALDVPADDRAAAPADHRDRAASPT